MAAAAGGVQGWVVWGEEGAAVRGRVLGFMRAMGRCDYRIRYFREPTR
jgi:hypothetical protein